MSIRKRLLRIFLILFGLGLFVGYFAFSTLLYKPLEADYEFDVAALISAKVDFFAAKARLEDTFDGFPRLAVADRLEENETWRILSESQEYNDLRSELGLTPEFWEKLRADLDQIPLGYELPDVFGGRDVAIAGNFQGAELAQSDFAVYGRVNWMGKLAVSLLKYPGLIRLGEQGISASVEDDHVHLTGDGLSRPLFVTRIRDVVIAATSLEFISTAHTLAQASGEESLFGSAAYNDHIRRAPRNARENELELLLDVRAMLAKRNMQGPWPDTKSESFVPAFAGRLFQAPSCKNVIGVIGTNKGLQIDLYGNFSSELIDPVRARVYRAQAFDRARIREIADHAPEDSVLFVYIHGPVGDLLKQVFDSVEPALRENLQDSFRSTGRYDDLDQVIEELSEGLHNRLAFVVRPNDYPHDPNGAPHDDTVVFAFGLVTWFENLGRIEEIQHLIGQQGAKFGIEGRDPGSSGFMAFEASGFATLEYWSRFVPGTGMITTMNTEANTYIANAKGMLDSMLKASTQKRNDGYPSLADRSDFQALLDSSLPSANVLVWLNPREGADTLRRHSQQVTEIDVASSIDWGPVRAREEAEALRSLFPGKAKGQLTESESSQLDMVVEPELRAYREQFLAESVPREQAKNERRITYFESVANTLLMLRLEPKQFRFSARVNLLLDE